MRFSVRIEAICIIQLNTTNEQNRSATKSIAALCFSEYIAEFFKANKESLGVDFPPRIFLRKKEKSAQWNLILLSDDSQATRALLLSSKTYSIQALL